MGELSYKERVNDCGVKIKHIAKLLDVNVTSLQLMISKKRGFTQGTEERFKKILQNYENANSLSK